MYGDVYRCSAKIRSLPLASMLTFPFAPGKRPWQNPPSLYRFMHGRPPIRERGGYTIAEPPLREMRVVTTMP